MDTQTEQPTPVPCHARPSTGFFHADGRCECFFGGTAPEYEQPLDAAA